MDKRILEKVSLKEIVEQHTKLSPNGPNRWKGKSPFTQEKTASFFVDDAKKVWYDYSSGESGGVVAFLMKIEKWEYLDAIKYLHEITGVPRENKYGKKDESKDIYALNKAAQEYFESNSEKARDYIVNNRKYPGEIVDRFRVGYVGKGHFLIDYLRKAGFSDELMYEASLLGKDERSGRYYPFFNERIIFPIKNKYGSIVGFTGRALDDDVKPKYLNSRETPVFKKSEVLWGYDTARHEINKQDRVLVSEGTFDIALQQIAGLPALGTLSANVSDSQLMTLGRISKNIYLTFDSDGAGMRAMAKTSLALFENDVDCVVYLINLPKDVKDSADYIAKYGIEAYTELVEKAIPDTSNLVRFFYEEALQSSKNIAGAKRKVLEKVKPYIVASGSGTYRQLDLMERVTQILNLSMSSLKSWLDVNPSFTHNSSVYKKIKDITFPAPIYERRLMTECMKDLRKVSTVYANVRREDIQSQLVLKVLDTVNVTHSEVTLFDELKEALTEEELTQVMDAYSQSATESYDILFLCEVANSNRAQLPRERLTNILGRKVRPIEKETRGALRDIAREQIGYKNL